VKKILRGHRREETTRFVAFRSHWRFETEFCTPAEPHEKGGIEGEAGYFRRNHWVPVPEAADLADMNRQLLNACQQDEHRPRLPAARALQINAIGLSEAGGPAPEAGLVSSETDTSPLIRRRPFDVVDYKNIDGSFGRYQLQPQLLLDRSEEIR
jgi:hypothetical protein